MVEKYVYYFEKRECYLAGRKLPKIRENSFKSVFQHEEAELIIENFGEKEIEISLTGVKTKLPTIYNGEFEDEADNEWNLEDYGRLIWNEEKQDYVLEKGYPKIFSILIDNFNPNQTIEFYFDFSNHLVQKDKDLIKPWYYYQWDIILPIARFIYQILSPHIKREQGEIVALPTEQGQSLIPWWSNDYEYNDRLGYVLGFDETLNGDYDFFWESKTNWIKQYSRLPALVISFLPIYFKNYQLEERFKMTGTRWFKKLMMVFGEQGFQLFYDVIQVLFIPIFIFAIPSIIQKLVR